MQVNIRPFEAQDLDSLVDLSLRAWVPVYESFAKVLGPDVFQRQYPDWRSSQRNEVQEACTGGKAHVWVADGGAKVVGFVAVVLEPEGGAGAVELLAVDPEYQGRDVGTTLTDFATTWMKGAGVSLVSIWTGGDPGHAPARRTYEKAGYIALPLVGLGHVRSVMACLLDRSCRWPGVLSEELAAVRCDLEDFAAEMFEPFARADQRRWGGVYLRGLLLDGGRKSVEPMAARLGEDGNRQALAHFVTSSPWDAAHVRARLAWRMQPVVKPTALVIDDTGFLKDGDASACVTRQYTGTAGKVTNCQAGVSLHLASNGASAAVNWRLFLPGSWDPASPKADPAKVARRDKCAIPAQVGHVEKWQLALDMIDETRSWGIDVPRVIADGGYGDTAAFRLGLETRGLDYVVGISTTTTAQTEDAQPCTPAYSGRGPRLVPAYPEPAQRVKSLVIAAGKSSARPVQWRQGSRPGSGRSGFKRMYSRFVALRIRPAGREIRKATATAELPVRWLLAEWPADQDEPVQFWLSNLPETTPLPVLVRTAKLRWRIENDYREMKQALGLAHFEGRTWPGWHHHVTLVSVAHAFCTLQRLSRSPKETASA